MGIQYNILVNKLDDFIRKYYRNQIIRGLLLSSLIYISAWITLSGIEYFGHFSTTIRTIIFYFSVFLIITVLIKFIVIPVFQFFKIGKIISHKQAARIISKHFANIEDKLLNTLELANVEHDSPFSKELIIASIDQRINNIKPIPFPAAINIKSNIKYLKYLGVLFVIIILTLITSPAILTDGVERIVNHNTFYEPSAPFSYILMNDTLSVQKGGDFEIKVKIEGKYVPKNINVSYGGNNFLMNKITKTEYSYKFKNINNSINFYFTSDNINSSHYNLKVLPSPMIIDFLISIDVPEYTGEKDIILKNIGDVTIPMGSKIKWKFNTIDIDFLKLTFNDTIDIIAHNDTNRLTADKTFYKNSNYSISVKNKYFQNNNIVKYSINVIPDLYPDIKVNSFKDSLEQAVYYFQGLINDDYGCKKLTFNYNSEQKKDSIKTILLPINLSSTSQEFFYAFDFASLKISEGGKIEYYFEVWDNDAVNGSKSTKTSIYEYYIPSQEELDKYETEANKNIEEKLQESLRMVDELQKDLDDLQENLIDRNLSSWEKTKMIENISEKQNSIEKLMDEISNLNKEKNNFLNTFSEQEQELMEKQEQIEKLLENLMDEELQKLMDELNKLMEDFDKNKLNKLSEELKTNYDELSEQLDRNLEMLKRYEVEQLVDKTIDKLNELAEEQKQLSEDVKDKNNDSEELLNKQNEQSEEFNKAMEDYKKALEKNDELKSPMSLDEFNENSEDIKDEFQQGEQNMNSGQNKKASKNQKQNSQKLKDMASSMQSMMKQNQMQQSAENMDDMRQIIENTMTFSFDQEKLMESLKGMNRKNPKYMEIVSEQKKISDNFEIIKDSLNALAKRTPMLSNVIGKEIKAIEKNIDKSINLMEESRGNNVNAARSTQQYIMTSANNLALLLSEVLKQMQQQSCQQCEGSSKCTKPGEGKPKLSNMKSQQQSLKSQLKSMIQKMKEAGNKPGGNSINKQLAKMLAQQEIFKNQLGKLMNNGGLNPETMRKLNEVKRMVEKTENDIINKNITRETIKRQDLILTRLLEAENSEYQREIDKKRKSEEARVKKISNPKEFFEYKKLNNTFNEILNTSDIKLYKFYNEKYKQYIINLNQYK